MSNNAYLCISEYDGIRPDCANAAYDVLAYDVACIPLLWMPLFRPADVRRQRVAIEESTVSVFGPVAPVGLAVEQLTQSLPLLNRLFAAEGPLDQHVQVLAAGVASSRMSFISILLDEIDCLYPHEARFSQTFRAALASFDAQRATYAARSRLVEVSRLRVGQKFPRARRYFDSQGAGATDDDHWNMARLLGSGYMEAAPWEAEGQARARAQRDGGKGKPPADPSLESMIEEGGQRLEDFLNEL